MRAIASIAISIVASCGGPTDPETDDVCVTGEGAGSADSTPTTGWFAQAWLSSESDPFVVDEPRQIWFKCPLHIEHRLERQSDLPITSPGAAAVTKIEIDPTVMYQSILGTGISMEESSVFNLLQLSHDKRTDLLTKMFDPVAGMGLDLVRVTMGSSDFTGRPFYTYDDLPDGQQDPNLDRFSIQKDIDFGIIAVLQQIAAIDPRIKFFASPWSPPAWMKTSDRIAGGSLRSDKIAALAKYFRAFVEAYRAAGIPIYAVTLQNEPQADSSSMPSCLVSPEQEAELVKAIKAEFAAAGITTRTWALDHNFDIGVDYAGTIFRDRNALAATDGIAFHDYAGDPSAMTTLHDRYPDKDILFTEKTLWGVAGVDRAAQYFRNWSRSYVSWLTMLDQNGLPNSGPASQKPRRFMRSISFTGDEYYATPEHYLFGLYSKFVRSGARRISSTYGSARTVTNVAFRNPDGTIVVVVINQTTEPQQFVLASEGNQIWASLDPGTAGSYVWRMGLGPSSALPVDPAR